METSELKGGNYAKHIKNYINHTAYYSFIRRSLPC